jgi:putative membrane protein
MTTDWLLASAHHIALLILVSMLAGEAVLMRLPPSGELLARLGRLDLLYGISAGLLLAIGGSRVVWGAKGWAFYSGNPAFWCKIVVFAVIGILSIGPTVKFFRWRSRYAADGSLPLAHEWSGVRRLVMIQAHALVLVAVAAAAMARGIGMH